MLLLYLRTITATTLNQIWSLWGWVQWEVLSVTKGRIYKKWGSKGMQGHWSCYNTSVGSFLASVFWWPFTYSLPPSPATFLLQIVKQSPSLNHLEGRGPDFLELLWLPCMWRVVHVNVRHVSSMKSIRLHSNFIFLVLVVEWGHYSYFRLYPV